MGKCLESRITIDTSTLERIVFAPQMILENEEALWEDDEALSRFVWERCIAGRAYYVAGAHMCQVIEERMGRDGVIETLVQGPAFFVRLYNSLVEESRRVCTGV